MAPRHNVFWVSLFSVNEQNKISRKIPARTIVLEWMEQGRGRCQLCCRGRQLWVKSELGTFSGGS